MGLQLITPPYTASVVSVEDLKQHLRVVSDSEDAAVEALGIAATRFVEDYCQRALITSTWELTLPSPTYGTPYWRFGHNYHTFIRLPLCRVQSVTSVKYLDTDGAEQTLSTSDWKAYLQQEPGKVRIINPPTTDCVPDAYRVRFVAGYGSREDVPETIKVAVKLLVGEWYQSRELTTAPERKELPLGLDRLLAAYRDTEVV